MPQVQGMMIVYIGHVNRQLLTFFIFVVINLIRIWNSSAVIDHVIYTVIIVISVGVAVIAQSISVSIRLKIKASESESL